MNSSKEKMIVYLETSTLLPLMYNTPRTDTIIDKINEYLECTEFDVEFYIHSDCLLEIIGMFQTHYIDGNDDIPFANTDEWKDIPEYRAKILANISPPVEYSQSDALSLLIGGRMTSPSSPYTNVNRFHAFYYSDIVTNDSIRAWCGLSEAISKRKNETINDLCCWITSNEITFPHKHYPYPGWGRFYKQNNILKKFKINVFESNIEHFNTDSTSVSWKVTRRNKILGEVEGKLKDAILNELTITLDSGEVKSKFPWKNQDITFKNINNRNKPITYTDENSNTVKFKEINRDKYHFLATYNHALSTNMRNWNILVSDGAFKINCKAVKYFPGALDTNQSNALSKIVQLGDTKKFD